MIIDIKVVLYEQKRILTEMLELLDEQFLAIAKKNIESLNELIPKIENISKELATIEMKRRSICQDKDKLINIIERSEDENLKETYKAVKRTLDLVKAQYEANEMLLRKDLMFTKKMMNLMKPSDNKVTTYNSYGQIKR